MARRESSAARSSARQPVEMAARHPSEARTESARGRRAPRSRWGDAGVDGNSRTRVDPGCAMDGCAVLAVRWTAVPLETQGSANRQGVETSGGDSFGAGVTSAPRRGLHLHTEVTGVAETYVPVALVVDLEGEHATAVDTYAGDVPAPHPLAY